MRGLCIMPGLEDVSCILYGAIDGELNVAAYGKLESYDKGHGKKYEEDSKQEEASESDDDDD